ncbi:MAG: DUF697 domain-containing protein [Psychrosphaera sp.]|nr:DUF697 domain-containing protein [Psychrosphaera sp.]
MTDLNSIRPAVQAAKIVNNYVKGAVAVGLVPIPLVDLVAISGIQLKMLHAIAGVYDYTFSQNQGKSLIASLLGSVIPLSLKNTLFSLVKSIPVVGQTIGVIAIPVLGGAATYAIGQVFIQHFESGGTLLDFDPDKVRDFYHEQFVTGKQVAKESYVGVKP